MNRNVSQSIDLHVGARIRLRRTLLGLSQHHLGKALGLTFQQIQKYEKGVNRISAGRLYQIAKTLEIDIQYFYTGYEDKNNDRKYTQSSEAALSSVLNTPDGLQIGKHYARIEDPKVKKTILELVKTLSEKYEASA